MNEKNTYDCAGIHCYCRCMCCCVLSIQKLAKSVRYDRFKAIEIAQTRFEYP